MKYKKILAAGDGFGARETRLWAAHNQLPAVDKKWNPTGYSQPDDDLSF